MELYIILGISFIDLFLVGISAILTLDYIKLSKDAKKIVKELKELEKEVKFKLELRGVKWTR